MRLGVVAALAACAAAAQTRKPPFVFTDVDRKLLAECEALDRQFERRGLVFHDPAVEKHVQELGASLAPPDAMEGVTWHFRILRDPTVNAFALPSGSIYLHSGLLARMESDDQVAAVLSHELAHVTQRHPYIFNRSLRKKSVASVTISSVAVWLPFGGALGASALAAMNVSQFALIVSVFGYSRELEAEADTLAVERMRASGRDLRQLIRTFVLLDERIEPLPEPFLLRTHDKTAKRLEDVKAKLGLSGEIPAPNDSEYLKALRPVVLQNLRLDLDSRRYRSAVLTAARLVESGPTDVEALVWLGEAYTALGPRKPRLEAKDLGYWSQRRAYSDEHNRPEQEQAARLAATPEGKAALAESRARAEEAFRKAMQLDPNFARAYLGAGILCQSEGKKAEAEAAFRKYLALAPDADDRLRVERRIETLRTGRAQ